jgi:abortive infection bacteriophage resistance protein
VKYLKPALSIEEQADLLIARGMVADRDELIGRLNDVSYYRLSGYWHAFLTPQNTFIPHTNLKTVWDTYTFDRRFRLLVLDAIERVEVSIRNGLILRLAVSQGAFGYRKPSNLPNIEMADNGGRVVFTHNDFLSRARMLCRRELNNGNQAVRDFCDTYDEGAEGYLPYWMLLEVADFGTLCQLLHGTANPVKKSIASRYDLQSSSVLESWMGTLRGARNNCAHLGRFWNKKYPVKPVLPNKKSPKWHVPVEVELVKDRAFGTLTILKYLLGFIAPQSGWADRLEHLIEGHPRIDRSLLGYPANWKECPIWAD